MARRAARVTMEETVIVMEESEEMLEMDTHNATTGISWPLSIIIHHKDDVDRPPGRVAPPRGGRDHQGAGRRDHEGQAETGQITLRKSHNASSNIQMFLDDVGVTIAMITVTLLAVCVVLLKVIIFSDKVSQT